MQTAHNRIFPLSISLCLLLSACGGITLPGGIPAAGNPPTATIPPAVTPAASWVEVFFTNPTAPDARYYEGGPDELLAAAIDAAVVSVDIAAYNFNLWSLEEALLAARRRGVEVRMVMESDNMDAIEVQHLRQEGIPIISDRSESLMHNKFVVIDRFEVWTGSLNYTAGGTYNDYNNLLHIRSLQVAENYTAEFDEMFEQDHFGTNVLDNTPHPRLSVNSTIVEVFFSPDDGVSGRIVELLQQAEQSIHFLAYAFTSDPLAEAIIAAAESGVAVSGVVDSGQANATGAEYDNFRDNGLNVRLDGASGLQHNKVIIIDESILITGSYNFTASAEERNDENLVIIYDARLASAYMAEFRRIYGMSVP